MNSTATKKTVLRLSRRNELEQYAATQHINTRFQDVAYASDGKAATEGSATTVLSSEQTVRRVSVGRDYDGNLFITLEE